MSCNKTYRRQRAIQTFSTNSTFTPMTPWMPITGMGDVNMILEVRGEVGSFRSRPAYQLAEVRPQRPDAWVTTGMSPTGFVVGDGIDRYTVDMATAGTPDAASAHFWVRFGVEASLTTAGHGSADVTLTVTPHACGKIVGRRTLVLQALTEEKQYEPVTGWISTAGLTAAKAAIICSGNSAVQNSLKFAPAYRLASEDPTEPGSWADLGSNENTATNNTLVDIPDESLSVGSATWIQLGIRYNIPTSGTPGQTTLGCTFAVKS